MRDAVSHGAQCELPWTGLTYHVDKAACIEPPTWVDSALDRDTAALGGEAALGGDTATPGRPSPGTQHPPGGYNVICRRMESADRLDDTKNHPFEWLQSRLETTTSFQLKQSRQGAADPFLKSKFSPTGDYWLQAQAKSGCIAVLTNIYHKAGVPTWILELDERAAEQPE